LEGLEVSEVMLSDVFYGVETLRLDSEYYNKKYLSAENYIKSNSMLFLKLSEMGLNVDGSAFYPALEPYYNQGNYPFLRVGDIKDYIDYENCIKVPFEILYKYPTLKHCKKGDIVLTKGGTVGLAGLITQDCCVTRDLIFINSSILLEEDYICLFLYLSTKFSYYQLIRSSSQSVQPHLTITLVRDIAVFKYSPQFRLTASKIYKQSVEKRIQSQTLYHQAEELLLETIGLKDFQPSQAGINIKSLKESFLRTGRLDAEYYQPKYEEIENLIKTCRSGYASLDKFIDSYSTGYPYKSETYINNGIPLVRINNLTKKGLDLSNAVYIPKEDISLSSKDIAKENDILISMSGTIGLSCVVTEKLSIVINQRIMKITPQNYNSHVLVLLLNSPIGKYQLNRIGTGGVQTNVSSTDIKDITIPVVEDEIQQQISELVEKSFYLCEESKRLLDEAKEMVEKEIENENSRVLIE
jgi:restriction endonuclease S subunit